MELNQKVYILQPDENGKTIVGRKTIHTGRCMTSGVVKALNEHYATLEIDGKHVIVERTEVIGNCGLVVQ